MAGIEGLLTNEEVISLPNGVKEKIQRRLDGDKSRFDEIEAKYERLKVDSEQQFFELEKQFINSKSKLESETHNSAQLKAQVDQLDKKHSDVSNNLRELQEKYDGFLTQKGELERSISQLTGEREDLVKICERRANEIIKLNDEWKAMSERVTSLNNAKCEALAKLDEVQAHEVTSKFREQRLEQEKNQMKEQLDWLNNDLKEKTKELILLRKDQSGKFLELQSKIDEKTEEAKGAKELSNSLKQTNDKQAAKIESIAEKLKQAREQQSRVDEQHRNEVHSQTKLVNLYKESSEEMEARVKEMTTAVEELQKLIGQAQTANSSLENQLMESEATFKAELNLRDEQISKYVKELANANTILEQSKRHSLSQSDIEAMSPSAAAVSNLLKSGKTLTQIYSEYVEMADQFEKEKEENRRFNMYLEQILQEIEEKAPIMKKQRKDYEHALECVNHLTNQLDAAMRECEQMRISTDDSQRRFGQLTRDNARLKQQTVDLGLQVRVLLKELEEARGSFVTTAQDEAEMEVSSSSHVITRNLVSFRSIEELQGQNQNLLQVVRELSDKQEEDEKSAVDSRTSELKGQLDLAMKDLESMKYSRTKQAEMVESLVRQRDMYRVLLAQNGTLPDTPGKSTPKTQTPVKNTTTEEDSVSSKELEEAKSALLQLRTEYDTYKRERAENNRMLNEQIEALRTEASDLRLQNSKLASQLDFSAERFKILQSNNENAKKEIEALRDKNQKFTISVVKHEQTINTLRQELQASQEYQARSEVQCENLRSELSLVKQSEVRLQQEKESMLREKQMQSVVLANLQTIQNNLERSEFEVKTQFTNRNESLERELKALQRKFDGDATMHRTSIQNFQGKLATLQARLDASAESSNKARDELVDAYSNLHSLKQELSSANAKLASAEVRLARIGQPSDTAPSSTGMPEVASSAEELRDVKDQLVAAQTEITNLQEQLKESKEHANQYKSIAESVEESLSSQNQVSREFKDTMESQLEQTKQEVTRLEGLVQIMDKERQDLQTDNIRISEESHSLNAELRKQLATIQNELEDAVQRREQAIANEQEARHDSRLQQTLASDAQEKYERELMLHSTDVENLTKCRAELKGFQNKLNDSEEEMKKAQIALESSKESWTEQERLLKNEAANWEKRAKELNQQNTLLHDQLQTMSTQMMSIQQRESALDLSFGEESSKTSEQLLEVIKFLRREKEISETKCEVSLAESSRVKQKLELVEAQLKETSQALNEETEKNQVSHHSNAQHAELLRKVENLNLLSDSNRMLREEKERLMQQVRECEAKINKLESDMGPLNEKIRDLTATKEVLYVEKTTLTAEIQRWKTRTNQLIEQANRADPEERKKLLQEKEEMRKNISEANEEGFKNRAEISRLKAMHSSVQNDIASLRNQLSSQKNLHDSQKNELDSARAQIERLVKELNPLKTELETKKKEIDEKAKIIVQLRKVGRKYRTQYDMLQKEMEELKAKSESTPATTGSTEQVKSLEEKVSASDSALATAEQAKNELVAKYNESTNTVKTLTEQLEQVKKDLQSSQDAEKKLRGEFTVLEAKQSQSRTILQTAKSKLTSQKGEVEKLTAENKSLKEKMSGMEQSTEESGLRESTLKSHHQSQITKLESDLKESQEENKKLQELVKQLEGLQRENTELQQRVQQLHKLVESAQQAPTKTVERSGQGTSEPPTANIRPMATPAVVSRQGAPTVPVQPVTTSAGSRVTASIRPIAKTQATSPPSTTPTATVLPTQQEIHEEVQVVVAPNAVRPTQQVQPVSPRMEEMPEETPVPEQAPTQAQAQPSTSQAVEPSHEAPSGSKRQREEPADVIEQTEEEGRPDTKRTRTEVSMTVEEENLPETQEEDVETRIQERDDIQEVDVEMDPLTSDPQIQQSHSTPSEISPSQIPESSHEQSAVLASVLEEEHETVQEEVEAEEDDDDDIIVVESDEEDEGGQEEDEEEGSEEDYEDEENIEYEGEGEYDEEEDQDVEYEGDEESQEYTQAYSESPQGELQEEAGSASDDDDDIVIVEDVAIEGEQRSQASPQTSSSSVPQMSQLQPLQGRAGRVERLPSVGRSQLAPFAFTGHGAFEDGDDGIVPSTPTLFLPRRNDGFAEAVSSPMVAHGVGFFSGSESQPELGQLASQGAMGMDDTRMDLSQFDDGSGRSVPTTPLQPTPPVTVTPPPNTSQQQEVESSQSAAQESTSGTQSVEETAAPSTSQLTVEESLETQDTLDAEDEEEEEILEGDQGEEDHQHHEESVEALEGEDQPSDDLETEAHGEGSGVTDKQEETERTEEEMGATGDQSAGGQDKADSQFSSNRPRIQRITWGSTEDSSGGQSQPIQAVGPRRGGPLSRGTPPSSAHRGGMMSQHPRGGTMSQHGRGAPMGQQVRGMPYRRGGMPQRGQPFSPQGRGMRGGRVMRGGRGMRPQQRPPHF